VTSLTINKLIYCEYLELGYLLGCQPKQAKLAEEVVSRIYIDNYSSG
jgi:hypothetical protein